MLRIHEQARQRFDAAKAHARRLGLTKQFAEQLNYLRTYAEYDNRPKTRVTLGYDFAPHSFSITWERLVGDEWCHWFDGGLIFHGPHDRGGDGGAPTFSVNLSPHHGWSIHT